MTSMAFRRFSILALGMALLVAGSACDSCSEVEVKKARCVSDTDCGTDGNKYCDHHTPPLPETDDTPLLGCTPVVKECTNEGQCCPGQICATAASQCFNKFVKCTDDTTCTVKGQVCKDLKDLGEDSGDKGCTFALVTKDPTTGEPSCPEGTNPFNGYCVGEPPCNGGCQAGSVCTPVNNRCFLTDDPNNPFPASCQQNCKPGTILVFEDGLNVFNRCDRRKRECACQALPPVRANDVARYSSAAVTGDSILVSAYDGDHGDLVIHAFDKAANPPKLKKTEWIDGVPTTGAVVGDPDGPRGGRASPGADVGQYTAMAFDGTSNITHIAYYAVKDGNTLLGNLKYAYRSGTGSWKTHTVDGATDAGADTGDVGMYASLALSPDGFPVIAYFQKGGVGNDAFKTALKVARAKVRTPEKAADWTVVTVEGGTRTPPPCASPACTQDEVCTESSANPNGLCRAKAKPTDCKNPACASDEACAMNAAGQPACFTSLRASTLAALPEGNGLFPAIAYFDDKPVIAWYDNNKHVLKGVVAKADSASAGAQFQASDVKVLDDGVMPGAPAGSLPHDVGQFASLAVGPQDAGRRLAVSYFDASARQLRVITATANWGDVTPVAARIVDDGKGTPEQDPTLFVGADSNIRFDASKNLEIVYQDSTSNDLRLAVQEAGGNTYKISTIAHDGAGGFYPNLLIDGQNRFATHAIIKAKSPSESANKLDVLKIQLQ